MPDEQFPVHWSGRTAVVRLPAEVDLIVADALREVLLSVLSQGARALIVDMMATTFCDSACISALVAAVRDADAKGAALLLAASSPAVLRVLSLLGIDSVADIFPTVDAALASLPHIPPQ